LKPLTNACLKLYVLENNAGTLPGMFSSIYNLLLSQYLLIPFLFADFFSTLTR